MFNHRGSVMDDSVFFHVSAQLAILIPGILSQAVARSERKEAQTVQGSWEMRAAFRQRRTSQCLFPV